MQTDEVIPFRQTRDVGEVITATFAYLRQNARSLGLGLLYIVGPVLAVQLIASSLYQGQLFEILQMGTGEPVTPEEVQALWGQLLEPLLLLLPASLLVVTLVVAVVYEHMRLYQRQGPRAVVVNDVWAGVKDSFRRVLATVLATFFGGVALFVLVSMISGVVIGGLSVGLGPVGAGLGVLLMMLGFVAVGAYLLVLFALLFPVRLYEDVGLGEAFGRCRRLLRGAFWRSLGVVFVVVLLYYIIAMAFSMPASILGFIWGFGAGGDGGGTLFQVVFVAANVVSGLGGTAAYCIPLVAAALYYYGLVEAKEHAGLAARVEQVGTREGAGVRGRGSAGEHTEESQAQPGAEDERNTPAEEDVRERWRPPGGRDV